MPGLLRTNGGFRALFLGQLAAQSGNKIYLIALSWYFVNVRNDNHGLAAMLFAGTVPILLVGPFAGPYIDRWNKRNIMIGSDLVSALLTLGVAVVVRLGLSSVYIYVLVFLLGITGVFFSPAARALVPRIVRDDQIQEATSLYAAVSYTAQFLGAAGGGLVVGASGVFEAILVNAATYVFSAASSALIRHRHAAPEGAPDTLREMAEGFRYVRGRLEIFRLLVLSSLFNIFLMTVFVFLPVLIDDALKLGPSAYGTAEAVLSLGSIAAAVWLAAKRVPDHLAWVRAGMALDGLSFVVIALGRSYGATLAGLALLGFMMNVINVNAVSFYTKEVDASFHGRFFNLMETISSGTFPLSFLVAGAVVSRVDLYTLFLVCGGAMLALGAVTAFAVRSPRVLQEVR